jgi:hypothetical protein
MATGQLISVSIEAETEMHNSMFAVLGGGITVSSMFMGMTIAWYIKYRKAPSSLFVFPAVLVLIAAIALAIVTQPAPLTIAAAVVLFITLTAVFIRMYRFVLES